MSQLLLLVEDEESLRAMLREHFISEGFQVIEARDGQEALRIWGEQKPALIVLDIMLPVLSGIEVLKQVRSRDNTPIIMLTARADEVDKLLGLELGADDYLSKPFSPRELSARVRAILRRSQRGDNGMHTTFKSLTIDIGRFEAYLGSNLLALTTTEFKILSLLAEHPGQVFSRLQILERSLGDIYEGYERTIDTHISNLRRKMEAISSQDVKIKTVYGVGYKLVEEE
ncbi:MAG: DNA-binding response regulator [Firmicutes bacterium HGW-Firmicutes-15]|nr:MAG: DNA-binding response regulator [Firmicutes bacterium HGW-Firmicutes-15]